MVVDVFGTPFYTCPEILDNQAYSPELADIWSTGVIMYELMFGV